MDALASEGLVARGLRARYRGGPEVLRGVDLSAARGEITALMGPNGSGKSTLLRALLGLLPSEGEVTLDGASLHGLAPADRARRIAYVPQRTQLMSNMTVRKVVELGQFARRGPFAAPTAADAAAIQDALEASETDELAERPFLELSGGEQQRVLLARALATGATTLLLDEPTSSQDVGHALDLHGVLRRLADQGQAVVVVLHDLAEIRTHTDRAVLLDRGRVHCSGPVSEVITREPLAAVYGVEPIEGAGLGYRRLEGGRGGER